MGGDYFGLDNDNDCIIPENVSTVIDLLEYSGIARKEYMESIPNPGYMGTAKTNASGHNAYVRKHKFVI